ncbi:methionine--tRNA ligase, mitochondrial-like isoform X2 [Venturia canescens]|uniref:methionine--tRNA ligase, mitochondrial-like isoform X2 n=1 Tax=Venturia canescens TaxID=32260 RepID=UPI001C9BD4C6|nr:methionine--tRNA ligase, mitochondrial-like isoform X2 [Venturia canescens]
MALSLSNFAAKSQRISRHLFFLRLSPAALISLNIRPIMTSLPRMEKALEHLKTNPYFEKYAKNIAKLQETNPEEFLARVEQREKKAKETKVVSQDFGQWSKRRGIHFHGISWSRFRTIKYEAISRRSSARFYGEYGSKREIFYVSTPIFYVNAGPHIGHLYSALLADSMSRYYAMRGYETVLSTGTDEHGNKVENAAKLAGLPVEGYCRKISSQFKDMCDQFDVGYTHFIRTTDQKHREAVQKFWTTLKDRNHIYLGKYSGWYCVPDENFVMSSELSEIKNASGETIKVSAESGHPVEWTEEENYKFRLSAFQNDLKYWLKDEKAVRPAKFHKILSDWIEEGSCLEDLSVSRPVKRAPWGIHVPNDETHTIYVWLDALVNYLTSMGYPKQELTNKRWPPSIQVIGKDILKFHGIYWPAFLIAAGLEPPKTLLCHSHWTVDGEKMSKSKGNVISPFDVAKELTSDGLRYFLLREAVPHSDGNYSDIKIRRVLNSELADTLGNLVSRCMGKKVNPSGEIADPSLHVETLNSEISRELVESLKNMSNEAEDRYEQLNLHHVVDVAMRVLHTANIMVERHKPWQLRKECNAGSEESKIQLEAVISLALESCRMSALVLSPIVPKLSSKLLDYILIPQNERTWSNVQFSNGSSSRQVRESRGAPAPVFCRIKI